MINNNIYALLIGVGDYKKIKITDLPSYRMDMALIGTGLISGLKCTQEHIEQSLDMFAGHGIAVYASSADDEVSRLGPNGNHSMFTGTLSSAMISPSIVHGILKITERNNIQYTEAVKGRWYICVKVHLDKILQYFLLL